MPGKTPYLLNPTPGWIYDLPPPCESPQMGLIEIGTNNPINYIDAHCLEIPSPSMKIRGPIAWIGLIGLLLAGLMLWLFAQTSGNASTVPFYIIGLSIFSTTGLIWFCIAAIRLDLFLPRDEPIRFNHSNQKVDFYHFKYSWLHPLSKTRWAVEISVHDWSELWLEACRVYGLEGGVSTDRVQISAQKNRTSDKRYSRIFSHSIRTGEAYWALIRLYMQQGQHALPPFKNPPQPREDEEMFYNIFWDYAPRVVWPADIDLESRTGPEHDVTLPLN